jgi:hypothetical protein
LAELPGIVLVDEVDAYLHPSWQRRVLSELSTTFPALQFFVTSHSPILAGSIPDASLFVCEKSGRGQIVRPASESVYGKTAEEILLSSYFGLQTTRNPEAEEGHRLQLERREAAARQLLQRGDEESARAYLALLEKDRVD